MNDSPKYFGYSNWEFSHRIMNAMREVMALIWNRRKTFIAREKGITDSGKADYVTNADCDAQALYVERFQKWFPGVGLIGEEDGLNVPCASAEGIVLTIDPLDGTSAFVRGQSHGIATMIGVLIDGELAGGYIGDVMTGEIYTAEPGSEDAWHYEVGMSRTRLAPKGDIALRKQYLLCRHEPQRSGELARALVAYGDDRRLYDELLIDTGSIGLHFARLWKGEVGGFLIEPSSITPWDHTPCYAISKRLGIAQIGIDGALWPIGYSPVESVVTEPRAMLYLPKECKKELLEWYARYVQRLPDEETAQ